jgi:hypothetical protein
MWEWREVRREEKKEKERDWRGADGRKIMRRKAEKARLRQDKKWVGRGKRNKNRKIEKEKNKI